MISVIIVNHNYGAFVGEAIESVLEQTYRDFEIIVVDGASSDNSRDVIMKYVNENPDIITAVFKPTSGQAAAFNLGYKLSRGEILAFLDADDYFLKDKLAVIAEQHKTYEFIGHDRMFHNLSGECKVTKIAIDDSALRMKLLHEYGYIYTYNIITSCMSITKNLAGKIFPMPEKEYITFADCYVKVMAQYFTNIHFIQMPLAYYRIHKKQETNSFENYKKLNMFVENLYNRVFRDINFALERMGEKKIPELTDENLNKALKIANPHLEIVEGGKYVIYGAGNNSYKIKKYIELMGGHFIYASDSNTDKWGKLFCELEIIEPQKLMSLRNEYKKIIIGSSYYKEISAYLNKLGFLSGKDYDYIISLPND